MIADNIKKVRESKKLTQQQMAELLGITRATYANAELKRRDFTASELEMIKEALGLPWSEITNPSIEFDARNDDKFMQMYLYILKRYFRKSGVTKTKLAKLLYLIDFTAFYENLESASGVTYVRRDYGPVADAFFALTDELYYKAKINIKMLDAAQMISVTPTVEDDFDLLTDEDKRVIDEVCSYWKDKRTQEIVDFTHSQKPWKSCRQGEEIPYSLIIQEDPDHVYAPLAE